MMSPDLKLIFPQVPNFQFIPENTDIFNNIIIYILHVLWVESKAPQMEWLHNTVSVINTTELYN